ncbi:hypothetical protein C8A01DRAFT_41262 [Parachaetomium inaequale]|uniref:Uncharacterized protein n=1 Tax=Parachaetomium inaequale TaxID=2588326 RepID=A0AAN6P9K3_9PEZI|nr:hypothetical protein C8A01DRAFT_41262 [Parachaetomium inaequale]
MSAQRVPDHEKEGQGGGQADHGAHSMTVVNDGVASVITPAMVSGILMVVPAFLDTGHWNKAQCTWEGHDIFGPVNRDPSRGWGDFVFQYGAGRLDRVIIHYSLVQELRTSRDPETTMSRFRTYLKLLGNNTHSPFSDAQTTTHFRLNLGGTYNLPPLDVRFGFTYGPDGHDGFIYSCIGGTRYAIDVHPAATRANLHVTPGAALAKHDPTLNPDGYHLNGSDGIGAQQGESTMVGDRTHFAAMLRGLSKAVDALEAKEDCAGHLSDHMICGVTIPARPEDIVDISAVDNILGAFFSVREATRIDIEITRWNITKHWIDEYQKRIEEEAVPLPRAASAENMTPAPPSVNVHKTTTPQRPTNTAILAATVAATSTTKRKTRCAAEKAESPAAKRRAGIAPGAATKIAQQAGNRS